MIFLKPSSTALLIAHNAALASPNKGLTRTVCSAMTISNVPFSSLTTTANNVFAYVIAASEFNSNLIHPLGGACLFMFLRSLNLAREFSWTGIQPFRSDFISNRDRNSLLQSSNLREDFGFKII